MTVVQLSEWRARRQRETPEEPVHVDPLSAPEATLVVSFTGLTEEQQRAAIAAFPGGRRFRLRLERNAHS